MTRRSLEVSAHPPPPVFTCPLLTQQPGTHTSDQGEEAPSGGAEPQASLTSRNLVLALDAAVCVSRLSGMALPCLEEILSSALRIAQSKVQAVWMWFLAGGGGSEGPQGTSLQSLALTQPFLPAIGQGCPEPAHPQQCPPRWSPSEPADAPDRNTVSWIRENTGPD